MAATTIDAITFGDNAARGPVYNKSAGSVSTGSYVQVLPVNPARKFLLIKPLSNHIHVHFLSPNGISQGIQDLNSFTIAGGTNEPPVVFDTFVPTNSVWMKANTAAVDVAIFEA